MADKKWHRRYQLHQATAEAALYGRKSEAPEWSVFCWAGGPGMTLGQKLRVKSHLSGGLSSYLRGSYHLGQRGTPPADSSPLCWLEWGILCLQSPPSSFPLLVSFSPLYHFSSRRLAKCRSYGSRPFRFYLRCSSMSFLVSTTCYFPVAQSSRRPHVCHATRQSEP